MQTTNGKCGDSVNHNCIGSHAAWFTGMQERDKNGKRGKKTCLHSVWLFKTETDDADSISMY